jgi:flagellar basal body-associated protein FliL
MRFTVAVEFEANQKEETLKLFQPRIRDAILAHLRSLTYEDATTNVQLDKLRADLLERCKLAGASGAERILITDFVIQ